MFRKFLAAVILAVFMFSAQIAAAANIDWSKAPRIGTKAELYRYIESKRRKNPTTLNKKITFHINFTNLHNFGIHSIDDFKRYNFKRVAPCDNMSLSNIISINETNGTAQIIIETKEYPGTRVANAYLSKSTDIAWKNLDYEEKLLYSEALKIIAKANKYSSEEEKARYIFNEIRKRATYYNEKEHLDNNKNLKPFCTAIGVKIDGKKGYSCEGYTDAFYMLGRMCNLDVKRIYGTATDSYGQWGGHAWNIITFKDGKSYCIDLISGLFKATYKDMKNNYECEWEIIPNLQ